MQCSHLPSLSEEEIFKVVMEHSQIVGNVGTVWGETTKLNLQMLVPDLKTWLLGLTAEEAQEFAEAIIEAKKNIHECPICYNLTDKEPLILQKKDIKKDLLKEMNISYGQLYRNHQSLPYQD